MGFTRSRAAAGDRFHRSIIDPSFAFSGVVPNPTVNQTPQNPNALGFKVLGSQGLRFRLNAEP